MYVAGHSIIYKIQVKILLSSLLSSWVNIVTFLTYSKNKNEVIMTLLLVLLLCEWEQMKKKKRKSELSTLLMVMDKHPKQIKARPK